MCFKCFSRKFSIVIDKKFALHPGITLTVDINYHIHKIVQIVCYILGLFITASKGGSSCLAERCISCAGVNQVLYLWRFSALGKSILPVWCSTTTWWETKLAGRLPQSNGNTFLHSYSYWRAEKRSDLAWLCWYQKKYVLISSCTHSSNTSTVGSGNTCRCK